VIRRLVPAAAVLVAAGLLLTGCAVHDSTGRVSVSLSSDAAQGERYTVKVYDEQRQMVEHQSMLAGQTADFAGVPLGKVTVRAAGLCAVHTTVAYDAVATVKLGTSGC
jgi:hypothetical protein